MSRHAGWFGAALVLLAVPPCETGFTTNAQDAIRGQPPEQIDILVRQSVADGEEALGADCGEDPDAGVVSGEIVVCARRGEASDGVWDQEAWENRYAEDSAYRNAPLTPDFIRDCHDQGMPFGCFGMGAPPPPVLFIDVEALPAASPGSDADRIARGLPALDQD